MPIPAPRPRKRARMPTTRSRSARSLCSRRSSGCGRWPNPEQRAPTDQPAASQQIQEALRSLFGRRDQAFGFDARNPQELAQLLEQFALLLVLLAVDEREQNGVLQEHAAIVEAHIGDRNVRQTLGFARVGP